MKKLSKRMAALSTKIEDRIYAPLEALSIIKENANAKFDETIEAHIRLGIDPKYTDQQLRTTVALPHGTGQYHVVMQQWSLIVDQYILDQYLDVYVLQ